MMNFSLRRNVLLQKTSLISLLLLLTFSLLAQKYSSEAVRTVTFETIRTGENKFRFKPQPPPVIQMAGAKEAFWSYFWEFGDGSYSFDAEPVHYYQSNGEYAIDLLATVAYDNGKPPTSQGGNLVATNNDGSLPTASTPHKTLFEAKTKEHLLLNNVRAPRAAEEFVVIGSYQNPNPIPVSGKLYFFFNGTHTDENNDAIRNDSIEFLCRINDLVGKVEGC